MTTTKLSNLLAALVPVVLAACTTTPQLLYIAPGASISRTVTRGWLEPHRVDIVLDGKRYRGEWHTLAPSAEQLKAARYLHRRHVGEVRSALSADDGSRLDCLWWVDGLVGECSCTTADAREYPLRRR